MGDNGFPEVCKKKKEATDSGITQSSATTNTPPPTNTSQKRIPSMVVDTPADMEVRATATHHAYNVQCTRVKALLYEHRTEVWNVFVVDL